MTGQEKTRTEESCEGLVKGLEKVRLDVETWGRLSKDEPEMITQRLLPEWGEEDAFCDKMSSHGLEQGRVQRPLRALTVVCVGVNGCEPPSPALSPADPGSVPEKPSALVQAFPMGNGPFSP